MNVQIPVKWLQELLALCGPEDHELRERVMVSITAMDEQAARAVAVPDGWREKFAADVYADLAAADNQDVPLEEYPARILKVLDSIVGPRHPVVIKWRNDAIRNCIAIVYKYCRDPESHKYLKQDLEAMLTTEPAPQAQADARDAGQEVLMEHSGCGSNTQVDMLTVRLNPGDKVVMHKSRITQGFDRANRAAQAAAKGE